MGYTSYWNNTNAQKQKAEYFKAVEDLKELLHPYADILAWESDQPDRPIQIDENCIRFNGRGEDGCETFFFDPLKNGFEFCKTRGKPYDLPVCIALLVLDRYYSDLGLSSDGDIQGDEEWESWAEARQLVEEYYATERPRAGSVSGVTL